MADLPVKELALRMISAEVDDLTIRQLAIFLIVATEEGPHRVRVLANRLGLAKPVVSRALDAVIERGWLTKQVDRDDARDRLFTVTRSGSNMLLAMRGWL